MESVFNRLILYPDKYTKKAYIWAYQYCKKPKILYIFVLQNIKPVDVKSVKYFIQISRLVDEKVEESNNLTPAPGNLYLKNT